MHVGAFIVEENQEDTPRETVASWVVSRCDSWREHRDQLYRDKWEEYNRIWRGIWAPEDRSRKSEKSRLVSPATQQAIESTVSELEEAIFGRGSWFDVRDDVLDAQPEDISYLRKVLQEDLEGEKVPESISEIILIGAIYGTGIGELLLEEKTKYIPKSVPVEGTDAALVGTEDRDYVCIKLNPVMPINFLIDPNATSVDTALGVAVEEIVPRHEVIRGIEGGFYKNVVLDDYDDSNELSMKTDIETLNNQDKVRLLKYYGLVPQHLLEGKDAPVNENETYVEAVVVIANEGILLKATSTPYFMKDRPIIAYPHDKVPGQFWGRGVTEKGYNAQKALDAELRARMDGLALTTHPLMGLDATRLPRGAKFAIEPGATILTNGNPKEVLFPFNFGNINPNTFRESAEFERMIQNATGAMDGATPVGINPRNSTASGMSMIMAASMKRQKRTLSNFQSSFLIPLINKSAWRYMQFDPDRYKTNDWKFKPSSTMGIMAREYEQQQFVQLLSMTEPNGPVYKTLLKAIIENSSFNNREKLMAEIDQSGQPSPEQQQAQQAQLMLTIQKLQSEIELNKANVQKIMGDLQLKSQELQIKAAEISKPEPVQAPEGPDPFEQQLKVAELALEEKKLNDDKEIHLLDLAIKAKQADQAAMQSQEDTETKNTVKTVTKSVDDISKRLDEMDKKKSEPVEVEELRDKAGKLIGLRSGEKVVKLKRNK